MVKVKVKQSHYGPWKVLKVPEGWGSQILRQSTHEGGKAVSTTHRPPSPSGNTPVLISVRGWVVSRAAVRAEGLCQWKIPMTPSEIDPATFWFIAQCLNHCDTSCPCYCIEWIRVLRPAWHTTNLGYDQNFCFDLRPNLELRHAPAPAWRAHPVSRAVHCERSRCLLCFAGATMLIPLIKVCTV
jgi:hypothetical protein